MNRPNPDFLMTMNVPINVPTQEEVVMLSDENTMEPFLRALVDAGHLTREEVAAYIKFVMEFSSFTPFVMDSFLQSYRHAMSQKEEESRIIKPNGSGKLIVPS